MDPHHGSMSDHCRPAVGIIVCLKYLVYVLIYIYISSVRFKGVHSVEGSVPACVWSAGQGDTGRIKGSDVLTKPHSHLQQAKKCHFSNGYMPAHRLEQQGKKIQKM